MDIQRTTYYIGISSRDVNKAIHSKAKAKATPCKAKAEAEAEASVP